MAMDKIYFEDPTDWEDYLFDSTEYAMELDNRNPVLEGIVERLIQLGIQITCEDKKVITSADGGENRSRRRVCEAYLTEKG